MRIYICAFNEEKKEYKVDESINGFVCTELTEDQLYAIAKYLHKFISREPFDQWVSEFKELLEGGDNDQRKGQ